MSEEGTEEGTGEGTGEATKPSWSLGDLEEHPTAKKFRTDGVAPDEFGRNVLKSYIELEKKIGQRGIIPPAEGADPADVRRYFTDMGCPESPDKYTMPELPEGLEVDDTFLDAMREKAWHAGTNDFAWQRMVAGFAETLGAQSQSAIDQLAQESQAAEAELKKDWGAAYDEQLNVSIEAMHHVFQDDFDEIMETKLPDGSKIGNNPKVLRRFAELGGQMFTEGTMAHGVPHRSTLTPEEAKAEISRLQTDPDFMKRWGSANEPGHAEAVQHWDQLHALIYPGKRASGSAATGPRIAVTGGAHVMRTSS